MAANMKGEAIEVAGPGGRGPVPVSFEFFPPDDPGMEQTLWQAIQRLAPLHRASSRSLTAPTARRASARTRRPRILRETPLSARRT